MRTRWKNFIALCMTMVLLAGAPGFAAGTTSEITEEESLSVAITATHTAYLSAGEDGNFHPYAGLTRAEAVIALQTVLILPSGGGCPYKDAYSPAKWYSAVCALWKADALPEEEYFRPLDYITERELRDILVSLSLPVDGNSAVTDEPITRASFCVAVNLALGRACDEAALFLNDTSLYPDVPSDSEYFADIMEASTEHGIISEPNEIERWRCIQTEAGTYYRYGRLYCIDENGEILRETQKGVLYFGADGAYTTGNDELDGYVRELLQKSIPENQSGYEALKSVYLYIKDNFDYKNLGLSVEPFESVGWEIDRALAFFRNGGDTCFGFASALGFAARGLGFEAYIISGGINEYYYPHSWVIIPEDGVDWIYDVELEYARPSKHADGDLFGIRNYIIYDYWYDPWW